MLFTTIAFALTAFTPTLAQKALVAKPAVAAPPVGPSISNSLVTTYHNNNQRTGVNSNETAFITSGANANVNPQKFGKIWSRPLDGTVYAQPLFVPAVSFPNIPDPLSPSTKGVFNTIFVCTTHNSVYAFDAGGSAQIKNPSSTSKSVRVAPLWQTNFNFRNAPIEPVPIADVQSDDLTPEIGIVGTPVIDCQTDPATGYKKGILYVVAKTKEGGNSFAQRLHALDITTGKEVVAPVVIQASVPGTGDGAQPDGTVPFDPLTENQQAALTLVNAGTPNATIYVSWSSHGNVTPFHGWIMAYKASNLQLSGVYNTSPNGDSNAAGFPAGAGIWQSGAGPAVDDQGNLYVATGTGDFNGAIDGTEFGNSILKLQIPAAVNPSIAASQGNAILQANKKPRIAAAGVVDYFTPFNWQDLSISRLDLGSGGVVLLPDGVAGVPHAAVAAGEEGTIYVLDRDNLGQFNLMSNSVVQELPSAVGSIFGNPAYLSSNNTLYYQGAGDFLRAFQFQSGALVPNGQSTGKLDFPGASPAITTSPDGSNAIVWTLERMNVPPIILDPIYNFPAPSPLAVLHAYDANNLGNELFNAIMCGTRDIAGTSAVFTPPTVANGRVYIGQQNILTVFGNFVDNGVTPPPTQADHFTITGAVASGTNSPSISQKTGAWYSITAVGPDGNPIKLNSTVHLSYRNYNTNSLTTIGNLNFNDPANGPQSNVVVNYAFRDPGNYDLYVTDDNGHSSLVQNFDMAPVAFLYPGVSVVGFATAKLDHFVLKAPTQVRSGSTATISVSAVTSFNNPVSILVPQPGQINTYDTLPDGTQGADPFSPGYAYDTAQPSVLFFKVVGGRMVPTSSANVTVTVRGKGNHVFVVTDGFDTGTVVIKGI